MAYPPKVWNQLRGLTAEEIISALQRDGISKGSCKQKRNSHLHKVQPAKSARDNPLLSEEDLWSWIPEELAV